MITTDDFVLTMIGSGGDGVISAGEILITAAAKKGLYGMLLKSFGPQIRGGESSIKLRLKNEKLLTQGDYTDVMVVLNWGDFARFKTEYEMADNGYVISDINDKLNPLDQPLPWKEKNLKNIQLPISQLTKEKTGSIRGKNIFVLGILSALFNLPSENLIEAIRSKFAKKSKEVIDKNIESLNVAIEWIKEENIDVDLKFNYKEGDPKIIITGNDALSLGALHQELDFYASYPITPASEILQFLNIHLPKFGGAIVQAEDEIAAINMAIGASFAGKKSMTGTSGAGISLKSEAIGLASMAEIPLVIVNIQRGGPSTGIPTKFEQADLLQSLYMTHGDAPKVVIAPTGMEDTYQCANVAFQISEKYQIPVIILSDQFLGHRTESLDPFEIGKHEVINRDRPKEGDIYNRYDITDSGVSPMSVVGQKDFMYQTSGLEHTISGKPTSDLDLHEVMSEKRERKLKSIAENYTDIYFEKSEGAKIGVIGWGSSKGAIKEAIHKLRKEGKNISFLIPQLIYPLPLHILQPYIDKLDKLVVIEMSHSAQFLTYLKSQAKMPENVFSYHRAGGKPFSIEEIYNILNKEYIE